MTTEPPALTTKCPFCSSLVNESALGILGLTRDELIRLAEHVKEGTFSRVIRLAETLIHKIDPDRLNPELSMKNTLAEILQAISKQDNAAKTVLNEILRMSGSQNLDVQRLLNEIHDDFQDVKQKILGPGIGKVGELVSIKEFKAVMPSDDFSNQKSDSHGTDIVAFVKENKDAVGKVTISVKYAANWENEYLRQLHKNMAQEGTRFGMLVTRSLPADSLNDKVQLSATTDGGIIILAKPEYAPVTYLGLRQAVIAWHQAELVSRNINDKIREQNRIFEDLTDWLTGEKFRTLIANIEQIENLSRETDTLVENILTYIEQKTKRIQRMQKDLRQNLSQAEGFVYDLHSQLGMRITSKESGNLETLTTKGDEK